MPARFNDCLFENFTEMYVIVIPVPSMSGYTCTCMLHGKDCPSVSTLLRMANCSKVKPLASHCTLNPLSKLATLTHKLDSVSRMDRFHHAFT